MPLGRTYTAQDCSLARALEVVGQRWTLLIIRDCFYGVRRFRDLCDHLDIPRAVLSDRLQTLVEAGILSREEGPDGPRYLLTERGEDLWPSIFALAQWGERHCAEHGARRVFSHANCGADVTETGWCPACGLNPPARELVIRNGPGADPSVRDDHVSRSLRDHPHRLLTPLPEPTAPTQGDTA